MSLCRTLGIEKPVIQAPMAGVQNWELAVAVSNAGGLGSIPCGMLTKEQVMTEIDQFKAHSDKPYNLNFFCHEMPQLEQAVLRKWEACLAPFYSALSVVPPAQISGLRVPFDDALAERLASYKPPIISFHFGLPAPALVKRIKSWGTIILSSATTREEGRWLQANGADVVIAQGSEAGGHRGMFLTSDPASQLPLTELVEHLLTDLSVPVVAAGGIATHNDVQAMMQRGVSGVQIGTSYLLCHEAKTSAVHREALQQPDQVTALTNIFSGRLARGITNKIMQELNFITNAAPPFPYASIAIGPLRAKSESLGNGDFSPLWSGTNRRGCKAVSAAALTDALWANS